ncbi:hypothetical protein MBGDC06_00341 [Thermoplasmatales archaeon SCGC AB-539-C06]|nr:hypothetical protein MBGDC06_00341 [Thermoplasmatales archaeon SCGC AB-539-C06]
MYLSYATLFTLNSMNLQKIYTQVAFIGMILNVLLNIIIIPKFSYIGASMTTVVTELICFILMFFYLQRHFNVNIRYNFMIKFTFIMIIIIINSLILTFLNYEISFIISMFIYFVSLYIFGLLTKQDFQFLRSILKVQRVKGDKY